jgi:Domain of unknown function (DUF1850)
VKALLAMALAGLGLVGGGGPRVEVADRDGGRVAAAELPASGTFALEYRHSYYGRAARETFRAERGGFRLVAIASPSEAVLDYYELEGERTRRTGWWKLRPARPPRFDEMALAGTTVGRRTLVVGARRFPLFRAGGARHLRITVEGVR